MTRRYLDQNRVLVTRGARFLGPHLCDRLSEHDTARARQSLGWALKVTLDTVLDRSIGGEAASKRQ